MIKRKPVEHGVFEDMGTAKRYSKGGRQYMRMVSKSFVSVTKKWGITDGKVLDLNRDRPTCHRLFQKNFWRGSCKLGSF